MSTIHFFNQTYHLESMHTKQLLNLLREVNAGPFCECCYDPEWIGERFGKVDLIKKELDKREHVPNKLEAKEIRKQKMKERKNQSNKKYRR